jgi:hypothetical protein
VRVTVSRRATASSPVRAPIAKHDLAPLHGGAQGPFRGVVGQIDAVLVHEGTEVRQVDEQRAREIADAGVGVVEMTRTECEQRLLDRQRLRDQLRAGERAPNMLAGAVGLILIIAAVNVGGLLLARGAARQSELAVRASLGAGRGRLIRQLLTASVVLALPATALGVILAWLSLDVIVANLPLSLPPNASVALNLTVLTLTAALLAPTTLLFGLAPAILLSRVRIGSVLTRGSRQVSSSLSRRGGQLLIAAEVALAVILVAGAGLMIRSFMRISAVDLGFNPDGLLTMQVLPLERNPGAHKEYYSALLERLRAVPGIASVGLVDNFVLGGASTGTSVVVAGKPTGTTIFAVMAGYFGRLAPPCGEGGCLLAPTTRLACVAW